MAHNVQSATQAQLGEHAHPTPAVYVRIAVVLAIITLIELATFYIEAMHPIIIPVLLVLSLAKFVLVVGYYMHLKFDSKVFSGLFVGGLLAATALAVGFIALFHWL